MTLRRHSAPEPTDEDLVAAMLDGRPQAFGRLYERHRAAVGQHLLRIGRDPEAAADLTQEVFLRLWQRADQWKAEGALLSWLLRIATNLALNHLRSVKRRREQPIDPGPVAGDVEDEEQLPPAWMVDASAVPPDIALARQERRSLLRDVVARLSADHREVLRLVHDDHLETRAVASELGIPEGTVKSRLHHARKHIARSWRELGIDWEDLSE